MYDAREALRHELEARGFVVASDTVASRGELYVRGAGDLAAAVFEFKHHAREAVETMYQGRWTEVLPPRFAVMPAEAASDPEFELLEQMRITPLLFRTDGVAVVFIGFETALMGLSRER